METMMTTRSAREAHAKTVRLEAVATKTATHEEYRAKVRAEGRPDPGPWSTYAADLDARFLYPSVNVVRNLTVAVRQCRRQGRRLPCGSVTC